MFDKILNWNIVIIFFGVLGVFFYLTAENYNTVRLSDEDYNRTVICQEGENKVKEEGRFYCKKEI